MNDTIRGLAAAVLWTASASVMIMGTVRASPVTIAWGLYVALAACVVTGWIIVEYVAHRERVRVDKVVKAVVQRIQGESGVTRI